jgi:hypothetical protein
LIVRKIIDEWHTVQYINLTLILGQITGARPRPVS